MICKKCGMSFQNGTFCPICGKGNENGIIPDYIVEPKKSHKKIWIIICTVLLLALIGSTIGIHYFSNKPKKKVKKIVDAKVYYFNSKDELVCFEDGNITEISQDSVKGVPEGVEADHVVISNSNNYLAYTISHIETREEKENYNSDNMITVEYTVYELYKVNINGENIKIDSKECELIPRFITDDGDLAYYIADTKKIALMSKTSKSKDFAHEAKRMIYYRNTGDYVFETEDGALYKGNIGSSNETLITTDITALFDQGRWQENDDMPCYDLSSVYGFEVSDSLMPRILYLKNNSLYFNELANLEDSDKLVDEVDDSINIYPKDEQNIFYIFENNAYMISKADKKTELIKEQVDSIAVLSDYNRVAMVSEGKLILWENAKKETILAENVASDIIMTNNYIIYKASDDESCMINIESKKQEPIDIKWDKVKVILENKELIYYE